jgi:hypothetical protein
LHATVAQILQSAIGVGQTVRFDMRLDGDGRGEREKFARVLPCEIGDRPDHALAPEETVRKRGNVAHVDAGAHHGAGWRDAR